MLLLLFQPSVGAANPAGSINFAVTVSELYAPLNASGDSDLIFWNAAELYAWIDEAAQRLARSTGVFVVRDTSLSSVISQGPYTLPARHVATVQADLAGVVLRPVNVPELEALDASWPATAGTPVKFLEDSSGLLQISLYPAPDGTHGSLTVGLVIHTFPATISNANAFLSAPQCLREYFSFCALGEARGKETKAAMPEVAEWFRNQVGMLEQVIAGYWGKGQ